MKVKNFLLSCFYILFLSLTVQAQMPENKVNWRTEPLTWSDFIGEPDLSRPFHANTSSGMSYAWSMKTMDNEIELVYKVEAFFFPEESWVKGGTGSDHLLVHEQLHFDITELHARKLRKAMAEFDPMKTQNVKPTLQALYKRTEAERAHMQQRFDAETKHSTNVKAQLKWQQFVEEELKKLEQYSS